MTCKLLAGGSGGALAPPGRPYDGLLFISHRYLADELGQEFGPISSTGGTGSDFCGNG